MFYKILFCRKFQFLIFILEHNEQVVESKLATPPTASCGVPHQYCAHVPKLSATITWELKCRKIYWFCSFISDHLKNHIPKELNIINLNIMTTSALLHNDLIKSMTWALKLSSSLSIHFRCLHYYLFLRFVCREESLNLYKIRKNYIPTS